MEQFYPIFCALAFNLVDLLTGIVSAIKDKEIKSSRLRDGLFKKVGFILCYAVAWGIDTYGYLVGFDLSVAILPVVILYACTTELVSISKINPDLLPDKLMEMFHVSKEC